MTILPILQNEKLRLRKAKWLPEASPRQDTNPHAGRSGCRARDSHPSPQRGRVFLQGRQVSAHELPLLPRLLAATKRSSSSACVGSGIWHQPNLPSTPGATPRSCIQRATHARPPAPAPRVSCRGPVLASGARRLAAGSVLTQFRVSRHAARSVTLCNEDVYLRLEESV